MTDAAKDDGHYRRADGDREGVAEVGGAVRTATQRFLVVWGERVMVAVAVGLAA
jgi:hypothetical protein